MVNWRNFSLWTIQWFTEEYAVCSPPETPPSLAGALRGVWWWKASAVVHSHAYTVLSLGYPFTLQGSGSGSAFPWCLEQLLFQKGWWVSSQAAPNCKTCFFPKAISFPLVVFCRIPSRHMTHHLSQEWVILLCGQDEMVLHPFPCVTPLVTRQPAQCCTVTSGRTDVASVVAPYSATNTSEGIKKIILLLIAFIFSIQTYLVKSTVFKTRNINRLLNKAR